VVSYEPIGVVRSPFHERVGMPLQSVAAAEVHGHVEIEPAYGPGLRDLDGFSHLYLICHLHRSVPGDLEVVPYLDDTLRGVFATRSPRHPNPIKLSSCGCTRCRARGASTRSGPTSRRALGWRHDHHRA
jgi:tRNA (Thr-GGU) A37 N-methylase